MELVELERQIQNLSQRAARLERRQRRFLAVGMLAAAVPILAGWQESQTPQENIKARAISIVDKNGVARLVLGAPVPNPVVNGKPMQRKASATGIIFNDAAGNERGGMGMLDDGSVNLCFDDAKTERNCLFLSPKFGNGLAINDGEGNGRALLYLDTNNAAHLMLMDNQGHPLVSLPEASKQTKPQ